MNKSGRLWTVLSMLEWATEYFEEKKVPSPRMSIEWILSEVLGIKRLDIYLQYDRPLSEEELDKIRPMVKRRAAHEPLQYITGFADFMSSAFRVTPDVLIPRAETEQLVELVAGYFKEKSTAPLRILDIGTGSGCIPVSLKKTHPAWYCAGLDIAPEAIRIAKENAERNDAEVTYFEADLQHLKDYPEVFNFDWHVVISNPPYITPPEKKEMEPQVTEYEPKNALFHDSPVLLYEKIAEFASFKEATLFLEINNKLANDIRETVSAFFEKVQIFKDLDGNERFIIAAQSL